MRRLPNYVGDLPPNASVRFENPKRDLTSEPGTKRRGSVIQTPFSIFQNLKFPPETA